MTEQQCLELLLLLRPCMLRLHRFTPFSKETDKPVSVPEGARKESSLALTKHPSHLGRHREAAWDAH